MNECKPLAEGLLLNRTLRHLNLDHNWGLGDAGAAYLGAGAYTRPLFCST